MSNFGDAPSPPCAVSPPRHPPPTPISPLHATTSASKSTRNMPASPRTASKAKQHHPKTKNQSSQATPMRNRTSRRNPTKRPPSIRQRTQASRNSPPPTTNQRSRRSGATDDPQRRTTRTTAAPAPPRRGDRREAVLLGRSAQGVPGDGQPPRTHHVPRVRRPVRVTLGGMRS
jgi:hypothetical protein